MLSCNSRVLQEPTRRGSTAHKPNLGPGLGPDRSLNLSASLGTTAQTLAAVPTPVRPSFRSSNLRILRYELGSISL